MTNKEKGAGSRSEQAKGATGKDNKDNSAITDAERSIRNKQTAYD